MHPFFRKLILVVIVVGLILPATLTARSEGETNAPRIINTYPARREVVGPDATIEITFDQVMDKRSVEAAFYTIPTLEGALTWKDDSTLQFDPTGALQRGAEYTVRIDAAAQSAAGVALGDTAAFTFQVAPNLSVSQVIPSPKATEVEAEATITVVFDRPVVPLVTTGDQKNLPQPLTFSPAVTGKGEWLGTAIYTFTPDPAFAGGTEYTVTVSGDLKDVDGSPMTEGYSWTFRTVRPQILSIYPYGGEIVALDREIQVSFNQPMNRDSVRSAFTLRNAQTGVDVAGALRFESNDSVIVFKPSSLLSLETPYQITVTGVAKSASGEATLTNPRTENFSTYPYPKVRDVSPRPFDQVYPGSGAAIYFNTPMDRESFAGKITIDPPTEFTLSPSYDSLYINFAAAASTRYTITLAPGAKDLYGNTINESFIFGFTTQDYLPYMRLALRDQINLTSAYKSLTRILTSSVNVDQIDLKLAMLTPAELVAIGDSYRGVNLSNYTPPRLTRQWTFKTGTEKNKPASYSIPLAENEDALPAGIYYLEANSPQFARFLQSPIQQPSKTILVVATANLVTKMDVYGNTTTFVTDLKTGLPLPNVTVQLYYNAGGQVAGTGTTDETGIARIKAPTTPNDYRFYWVVATGGDVFSISNTGWSGDAEAWNFEQPADYSLRKSNIYLYTDQPIYRPGRPVYYRGIVRGQDDVTYTVPAGEKITLTINDPNGNEVNRKDVILNEYGAFSGQFDLLPQGEAPLGYYSIQVYWKGNEYGYLSFQVAEFRPPEFLVTAAADKTEYVAGETIKVTVDAKFLFGGAVSGGALTWNAIANSTFFGYRGRGLFDFGDPYGRGWVYQRNVGSGSGTLDGNGQFVIELPADLAGDTAAQSFTIEANAYDVSGQTVSGRTTVTVHPALLYLGIQPKKYLGEAGSPFEMTITSVGWQSEPFPNQPITVTISERRWTQDPKTLSWKQEIIPVSETALTTDGEGKVDYTFTPANAGVFEIAVTSRDARERLAKTTISVWVSGPNPIATDENDKKITLIADRKSEYKPGETAEILIPSPFAGKVTALVTVERLTIRRSEVIQFEGSYTYKLTLDESDAPNIFVAVTLIKGSGDDPTGVPAIRFGLTNLKVEVQKQLNITLTPSVAQAAPRDEVSFDVLVTTLNGEPTAAEVGLSLSDVATLSVGLPNSAPIFENFWYTRALGITTSHALTILIDGINLKTELEDFRAAREVNLAGTASPMLEMAGGGGAADGIAQPAPGAPGRDESEKGRVGESDAASATPRTDFVDTPLWVASLIVGADGRGSVSVTLPDNLTTWRLDARAISLESAVGDAQVEIISTKPLLVRPATPRFFTVGDETELAMVVNNNTGEERTIQVNLLAAGVTLRAAADQTITIPANGRARVLWLATVNDVANVDLTFSAVSGEFSDASKPAVGIGAERLLPVFKYEAPDYVATAGVLRTPGERTEGILLPPTELAPSGMLTVKVNPSLAATTLDGLDYLKYYPYYCVEQTVSRFLPNIITYRALQKVGLDTPELRANLETAVLAALARLKQEQKGDGGWGWYPLEESNPLTTAYALLGLLEARDADFAVEPEMIARAVGFLLSKAEYATDKTATWQMNRQAFMQYVLARAKNANIGVLDTLLARRERMSLDARAYLALAYATLNRTDAAATLLSDLQTAAIASATGIHWEEESRDYWNWGSNTRTTALALLALVKLTPESDLVPNVVRWLMVARRGDAWESTQETAWAVMALVDYMVASGELKADYTYTVNLNGTEIGAGVGNADTLRETKTLTVNVAEMLRDQVNRLTFDHAAGDGSLYYTAALKVNQPVEAIKPTNRGLSFTRAYYLNGERVTEAKVGETIKVVLEITASQDLYYVVINDPIPAGTEGVDRNLQTTSQIGERPELSRSDVEFYGWGWWYFSSTQIRTEKVVLSAQYLPRGNYRFVYEIQATTPGTYRVIPPNGNEFYFPEVFGRGAGSTFTVHGE